MARKSQQDAPPIDDGRRAVLDKAVGDIIKRYGEGSIMRLGEAHSMATEVIPTGSLSLDIALGVGGVPRGRITEIYGPESSGKTTLCQHIVAEAQKMGGTAAFIDMEHALDPVYAARVGVDIDNLLVSQPDTGEQALEITETLVRSGAVDVVVIDSVAALVPRSEIEGDMGDPTMGVHARLMSQALRKLSGAINQTKTAVIFTNQLRQKIGVMFGCFHYNARVVLANGATEKIGKIVNQRLPLEVLSYNQSLNRFEPRRIVNWFDNGRTDHFLEFLVDANEGNGRHAFACTPNHLLLSEHGWRRAEELRIGDRLMTAVTYYLSPEQLEVVRGSLLGDGSFRRVGDYNAQLRIGHGTDQKEYVLWKQSLFGDLVAYRGPNSQGGLSFDTIPMYELTPFVERDYNDYGKDPSPDLIATLTPLALAIWYMDDGTFDDSYGHRRSSIACGDIPEQKRHMLVGKLAEWGIEARVSHLDRLEFNVEATERLHALISPYVHPSMAYKLLPQFRECYRSIALQAQVRKESVPMPILKIYDKPYTRGMHRFDIEVEGNHAYVVEGVVVHNSPETTTGGQALKFYASVRLDVRRIQSIKVGAEIIGNRTRVRVVKNKVAPPFRTAEFDIMYNEGISKVGDLLDLATQLEIVDKRGTFFSYGDVRLGQGRENAKEFLRQNPDLAFEIETIIRQKALGGELVLPLSGGEDEGGLAEEEI